MAKQPPVHSSSESSRWADSCTRNPNGTSPAYYLLVHQHSRPWTGLWQHPPPITKDSLPHATLPPAIVCAAMSGNCWRARVVRLRSMHNVPYRTNHTPLRYLTVVLGENSVAFLACTFPQKWTLMFSGTIRRLSTI